MFCNFLEQHARNVKSYRQQLVEKKKKSNNCISEDDFSSKFEKLELTERNGIDDSEEDDANRLDSDPKETESGETIECSDDGSHSEQSETSEKLLLKLNFNEMNYSKMR